MRTRREDQTAGSEEDVRVDGSSVRSRLCTGRSCKTRATEIEGGVVRKGSTR